VGVPLQRHIEPRLIQRSFALGTARSAIEALIDLAGEKRHERTSQPLSEDRGAQTRLAQAEAMEAKQMTMDEARRVASNIAKLPDMLKRGE